MPLGIQRLNARHLHPTPWITFLKPLPGPTAEVAEAYLARIAAQMHPLLRDHHLSITSLEEFEPNLEFAGRNFNAGEAVQLVLRSRRNPSQWLPFRHVAMVMVHEIAHCEQMNHGRDFWKLRNVLAEELRALWSRGYTGEGVWGRGRQVQDGRFEGPWQADESDMPHTVCGGTYRRRRRRKRRPGENGDPARGTEPLSYREREERRVRRKFGINGQALGDDVGQKRKLEKGRTIEARPRVAGSNRGRELRAAAALARFDDQKTQGQTLIKDEVQVKSEQPMIDDDDFGDEGEATYETEDESGQNHPTIRDDQGETLVKVCAEEDADDVHVKAEMQEMLDLSRIPAALDSTDGPLAETIKVEKAEDEDSSTLSKRNLESSALLSATKYDEESASVAEQASDRTSQASTIDDRNPPTPPGAKSGELHSSFSNNPDPNELAVSSSNLPAKPHTPSIEPQQDPSPKSACSVCSVQASLDCWICSTCGHVLQPALVPDHWSCSTDSCCAVGFVNAGDYGCCGLCGTSRARATTRKVEA